MKILDIVLEDVAVDAARRLLDKIEWMEKQVKTAKTPSKKLHLLQTIQSLKSKLPKDAALGDRSRGQQRIVSVLKTKNYEVTVNEHLLDQASDRRVNVGYAKQIIDRLDLLKPAIDRISQPGRSVQFWVYDPELKVSVGFRVTGNKIQSNTAIVGGPHMEGSTPVIVSSRYKPIESLNNLSEGKQK